MLATSPELTDC